MKAIEVTAENLEDLLAYDDVLLDFFNAFLALPVFSQPLYYNRLTGTFEQLLNDDASSSQSQCSHSSPLYGATDEEREKMMEWAKTERLPIFFRSYLFREYKLCRMLLRPLMDRPSAAGHGSGMTVRGYSRQTADSCISSLSRGINSAKDAELSDNGTGRNGSAVFTYKRPGDRAVSLPIYAGLGRISKKAQSPTRRTSGCEQNANKKGHDMENMENPAQIPANTVFIDRAETAAAKDSSLNQMFYSGGEIVSSHTENSEIQMENEARVDRLVEQVQTEIYLENEYMVLPEEFVLDELTEEGIKDLESRHKMTLQEMKECLLGSVENMDKFHRFLQDTTGKYLYEFWLDCESFKDVVEDHKDEKDAVIRSHLFRNIQDKYRLTLEAVAFQRFTEASSLSGLTPAVLDQAQYDALRRIRVYWIARYIIHKERIGEFLTSRDHEDELIQFERFRAFYSRRSSEYSGIFPSVSFVNSLPIIPDKENKISRSGFDGRMSRQSTGQLQHQTNDLLERLLREKLLLALELEKKAGGPFQHFLQRGKNYQLLCSLQFCQDVQDYSCIDQLQADRYLRLMHGWDIFNRYLAADSALSIEATDEIREKIRSILLLSKHSISVHVFSSIRNQVIERLQDSWINYLKQDLKTFLDHRLKIQLGAPYLIEDMEITFDETGQYLMIRHRPPILTRESSELTTEEERAQRIRDRQIHLERRCIMEKERRKAINAAKRRQREIRNALLQEAAEAREVDNTIPADVANTIERPSFSGCQSNKRIMSAFQRHLATAEDPELLNAIGLFQDIDLYLSLGDGALNRPKKEMQSNNIAKSYLQPTSKRRVPLNSAIVSKLRKEKERPKTPTLKDIRNYLLPMMESSFNHFVNLHIQQVSAETSGKRLFHASGKSREHSTSSVKSKSPTLTKEAFEAALLQSILTRPTAALMHSHHPPTSSDPHKLSAQRRFHGKGVLPNFNNFMQNNLPPRSPNGRLLPLQVHAEGFGMDGWKPIVAKINPTKDDRAQFQLALTQASAGKLPTHMWLYYEYLVQHGEEEGNPRLDKDLFFYCEVFKFKEASHAFADEELLKKKVQSIVECYVDSAPMTKEDKSTKEFSSAQIDASSEILQKTVKAMQRYISGKDTSAGIFDDAQGSVFKELLPYWVGFMRNYTPTEEGDRPFPLTRKMKERRRKLEEILSWRPPSASAVVLPGLPDGSAVTSFTFTLNDGFKWKEGRANDEGSLAGRHSNLEDLVEVAASTSNITSRKMSVISHSTIGDFKSVTRASIVSG